MKYRDAPSGWRGGRGAPAARSGVPTPGGVRGRRGLPAATGPARGLHAWTILGLTLIALLLAVPVQAGSVRDMVGREVEVNGLPARIVSLAPSLTEVIYALGVQELLVGVTTLCDYPPEAATKPKIGGIVNPSLEVIASLRPDLVLATTEGNRERTIQQLSEIGIPTYVVSPKSFSGVLESIARIGQLIGREEAARRLVADLKGRAARVMEAIRGRLKPRVLYLVWAEPAIVPGRDTLIADLILMAGGVSLSQEAPTEWPRFSLEQVVAMAPDVVLVASHGVVQLNDTLQRWQEQKILLPAFKSGKVHAINGNLVHRPGPRIVDGLEAVARAIHPGALP